MKKLLGFCAIALLLSTPLAANAGLLGTGWMDLTYSPPTGGGYYLDYDGKVTSSTFGYTTGLEEVFCVSPEILHSTEFSFHTLTPDIDAVFGDGKYAKLSRAAWIADNYWDANDTTKAEAQKAVWKIMGVMDITGGSGTDFDIYNMAILQPVQANSNWYFAYSPVGGALDYQDYLTHAASPTPEPSTLLLSGSGLALLARRFWRRSRRG